jgi:hypothetical protein
MGIGKPIDKDVGLRMLQVAHRRVLSARVVQSAMTCYPAQHVRGNVNSGELMNWIVGGIKWIMVVSGILTATMFYAAIAPEAALLSTFGETLDEPLAIIVVRNWGALIGLVGGMLIYGAFRPAVRSLVLIVAGASKAVFIALVLSHGARYLSQQAGVAVAIDSAMIVLFALYLLASFSRKIAPAPGR